METFDAIYARRAIKRFDPEHTLTPDEERRLLEAAIQSPTSFNLQHWRFVVVRDPALRARIATEFGNNQPQITEASLLIVMTADVRAWAKSPERHWAHAPEPIGSAVAAHIRPFYEGREWLARDEAQRSIGMAAQTLMLAAKAMGYDSCPMIGYDIEGVAGLINLPEDHAMGMMIAVGKGAMDPWPKTSQLPLSEVVVENGF